MSSNGQGRLPAALKSWLDNVVIPGLVREYLARLECEKMLATEAEPTVESAPAHAAVAEEGR